jgi:hypothetical protein
MKQSLPVNLTTDNDFIGIVRVENMDDLHYRFQLQVGSGAVTGVVSYRLCVTESDPGDAEVAMTMDGTINTIDVSTASFVRFFVTTPQSGFTGLLHTYTRPRPVAAV